MVFCPNCGKMMDNNASFCMNCGNNLQNNSTNISDNVIQRSQVGAASVGNINISPIIANSHTTSQNVSDSVCPQCGSNMKKTRGFNIVKYKGKLVKISLYYSVNHDVGYSCLKCGYKYLTSGTIFSDYLCKSCDNKLNNHVGFLDFYGRKFKCQTCNEVWDEKKIIPLFNSVKEAEIKDVLIKLGWDIRIIPKLEISKPY